MAQGRGVKPERVRQWVDGALYTPEQAVQQGIIDSVQHRQDFEAELRKKFGEDVKFDRKYGKKRQAEGVDFSSPFGLFQFWVKVLGGWKEEGARQGRDRDRVRRRHDPAGQARAQPLRRRVRRL